jgi:RimJ/RimL family protein N-acetyltransferase
VITTPRLVLRRWRAEDFEPLERIHADPEVAYWLGGPVFAALRATAIERIEAHFNEHGFGEWAIERTEDGELIGLAGLRRTAFPGPEMTPTVEIGWRLARPAWGQGYAAEAAAAALRDGFERAGMDEVMSWTASCNVRSQAVMRRIGLERRPELDFDHPKLNEGDPLRPHVVYGIGRP